MHKFVNEWRVQKEYLSNVCGWVLTSRCIEQLAAMLLKFFHTFNRINDIWKCKVYRTKTTRTFQITFSIANTRQHTNTSFLRESEFLSCLHFWNCRRFVDRSLICKLFFWFLFPTLYLIAVALPCGKIYCVFYFYFNFHSVYLLFIHLSNLKWNTSTSLICKFLIPKQCAECASYHVDEYEKIYVKRRLKSENNFTPRETQRVSQAIEIVTIRSSGGLVCDCEMIPLFTHFQNGWTYT